MKFTKKIMSLALAATMAFSLAACGSNGSSSSPSSSASSSAAGSATGSGSFGDGSKCFMTIAAPPSTSALYSFWVGLGDSLTSVYKNIKPTVSESQGIVAITKSIRQGDADIGNSGASTDYESYTGTGSFKGDADKNLRILFYYEVTWEMFCVDASSNITDVTGLNGKKFNPGGTGGSAEALCDDIMNVLNIHPNYFAASQSDAADAYANKEIVGTTKLGPTVDSYVMQLDASIPIRMLSLTDDQIAQIQKAYPYLISGTIPANTYKGVDKDVKVVGTLQGCQLEKDTYSQEEQYELCKAVFEDGASSWQSAYPSGAQNDLCKLTLESSVPLSAGTVQYLTEKGYTVPQNLIPPEYTPVK